MRYGAAPFDTLLRRPITNATGVGALFGKAKASLAYGWLQEGAYARTTLGSLIYGEGSI